MARVLALSCAIGACLVGARMASGAGSPLWPLAWRSSPSHRYVVQLPAAWRLQVARSRKHEVDSWVDPSATDERLVITLSSCAKCVTAANGGPDARAVLPARTIATSAGPGRLAFAGHTPSDPFQEHGVVIVTRSDRRAISGSIVLQIWMPDVLFPNSEDTAWSHILANFAAKGRNNY